MDAARETRRHLGQILVEEGLLTVDKLEEALQQHERTQRPLGEVLVELGMVSPGAIANALAEQHGGLLRTEYGISAGLRTRSEPEPESDEESESDPDGERKPLLRAVTAVPAPEQVSDRKPDVAPDVLEAWRTAVAERDQMIVELGVAVRSRDVELEQLRTEAAEIADTPQPAEPDTAELEALNDRLAATQAELEQLRTELRERDGQLAAAGERAAVLTGEHEALQARLASAGSSAEDSGRALSEAHVQAANFNAELQILRPRLAAVESELTALRPQLAEAEGRFQAERAARAAEIESSARKVANADGANARSQAQLTAREAELRALKTEAAERVRELDFLRSRLSLLEAAPVEPEPAPVPVDNGPHILFVPRNGGYELVERDGPPPARGETVEADAVYIVAKVGPSPRPGEQRTCVYLVRA